MKNENKKLVWNVFREDFSSGDIIQWNIFRHGRFYEDLQKTFKRLRKEPEREEVAEIVRRDLMYYFWSKCEYEIIISGFPGREGKEEKIDVYTQVMMNWDIFFQYLWENQIILRRKNT